MSRAVPSGRREGMFPGFYSELFGLGERPGYILNLVTLLTLSGRIFEFASVSITLAPIFY